MRASVPSRVVAKAIDFGVVVTLASVLPRGLGPLCGFAYSILADGLHAGAFDGQSVGKKLMGLQVRNTARKAPARFKDSVIRNAPVGLATFFSIIPVWGWLILFLVGIPLLVIELALLVRIETRQRLGDVMADTEVVVAPRRNVG
ncbi:MAG: RDD family protein [Bdellovibrionales bacterium]|nr:RDD family protein [Bdellovibrionales bacterium]